jgi:hypothetical protein
MTRLLLAGAFAAATALTAYAGTPLSQSKCDSVWNQANPGGAATITEAQAQPYVTDVKAANPDGDGTLDKAEFSAACKKGLVTAMAGDTGSDTAPAPKTQKQ